MPAMPPRDRVRAAHPLARAVMLAVALVLAVVTARPAAAERVRTTGSTKVYKRTGEQSAIVTRVSKGTTLQVVATSGRWLKVRVNGRTGWVTRTSVVSLTPATLPRNTRRRPFVDGRSLDRDDTSDAPEDRVGADAIEDGGDGREVTGGGDDGDDDDRKPARDDDDRRKPARDDDRDDDDDDRRKPARDDDDDRKPARDDDRRKPARADDDRKPARADDDRKPTRDDDRKPARDDDDDDRKPARDDDDDDAMPPAPMLTVRVARAELFQRPSRNAAAVLTLREGDQLVLLEEHRSGRWLRVEVPDDDAVSGYIARDDVGVADDADDAPPAGRVITATARVGLASIGGTFHSDGAMLAAGPPPDYPFGSTAIAIAIGGEATFRVKPRILVGGSARYLGCIGAPGIAFAGETVGFTTHDVDLLALGGYDLRGRRAITVWGRAGLHIGRFSVSDLANKAKLPVETVLGPMIGAAVRVRRITPRIGAEASLDIMPTAKRAQTRNQADGQLSATRTLWLQLAGTYAWRRHWRLEAGYQLGYAGTSWVGPSDRHMSATGATRTDLAHVFNLGATRPF